MNYIAERRWTANPGWRIALIVSFVLKLESSLELRKEQG